MKKLIIVIALALGITAFAEEKKQEQRQASYPVVMVEPTGAQRFFRSTGSILNAALKVVALPFEWAADGLDELAPSRPYAVPVVPPPPVVPVVAPPPVPVVAAPPAVIVNPYPSYGCGGYGYGYPPPPPRYYRGW